MFLTVLPVAPDILLVRPSSRSVTTVTPRSAIADTKPCSCSPIRFNPSWLARDSAPSLSCVLVLVVGISASPSTCWRGTPSAPRGPSYWLFGLLVSGCLLLLRFVGGLLGSFALFLFVLVGGLFGFFALFLFVLVGGLFGFFALFLFVLVGLFGFFVLLLFVLVSGLFGFFALFLLELGDLDLDSERLHDLSRGGCDPRCADDRCDCGEDTTNAFGVDIELARDFEVHQIRERGGINGDERSDANKHECFRVETRCGHRVCCHVCEKVEDRGLSSRFSHGVSFRSDERSLGQFSVRFDPERRAVASPKLGESASRALLGSIYPSHRA